MEEECLKAGVSDAPADGSAIRPYQPPRIAPEMGHEPNKRPPETTAFVEQVMHMTSLRSRFCQARSILLKSLRALGILRMAKICMGEENAGCLSVHIFVGRFGCDGHSSGGIPFK
jgi:hypothetical protein